MLFVPLGSAVMVTGASPPTLMLRVNPCVRSGGGADLAERPARSAIVCTALIRSLEGTV